MITKLTATAAKSEGPAGSDLSEINHATTVKSILTCHFLSYFVAAVGLAEELGREDVEIE